MIYVVCGWHRSGTSMMMRCLLHAGVPVCGEPDAEGLNVSLRRGDYQPNPNGFFDHPCKWNRPDWIACHEGKAIKVELGSAASLPVGPQYRAILMRRNPNEIRRSWSRMWGEGHDQARLAAPILDRYEDRLAMSRRALQSAADVIELDYGNVVKDPSTELAKLEQWGLRVPRHCIDPALHREKS